MEMQHLIAENALNRLREQERRDLEEETSRLERRNEREKEIIEKNEEIDKLHKTFLSEKFTVISNPPQPNSIPFSLFEGSPNPRVIKKSMQYDSMAIFFALHSTELWQHIADSTNNEIERKVSQQEVKEGYAKKYLSNAVTEKEIILVFALRQFFRTRFGNRSIEKQFNDLPPSPLKKWPITEKRYTAVMSSLRCEWEKFCEILRKGWCNAVNPSEEMTIDETIFSYYSQQDKTSPQVHIPRKPHPNGLLSNSASFMLQNGKPYLFDVQPEVKRGAKCNPRDALTSMLERRHWDYVKPKITIDAGFSGEEQLIVMKNMGYQFVAAVNIQHKRWLHNLLEYHCPLNSTLVVQDQHGLVWSFKKTQEKNLFVVTNMFGNTAEPKLNMPQLVNKESEEILGKLGKPILSAMIKEMKIVYENPNLSMQRVISSFLNQKYSQNLVEENTESAPLASTSNTHQVQQVCPQESDTLKRV